MTVFDYLAGVFTSAVASAGGILTGNISFSPSTLGIVGTKTNDNAAAGNVGEYITSYINIAVNFPTTLTTGDLTSISLTAGDWDISVIGETQPSGAVVGTQYFVGVSTTSGNSLTGLGDGDNLALTTISPTPSAGVTLVVPAVRASIASTTTFYYKFRAIYSAGTPTLVGRISARRIR